MNTKIYNIIPEIKGSQGSEIKTVITAVLFISVIVFISFLIAGYASKRWKGNKEKTTTFFIGISVVVGVLLLAFFGLSARAVRGIVLCHILMVSSYADTKSRECDDWLSVMVLLAAFIGTDLSALPGMLAGGAFVGIITLLAFLCGNKGIGGADIKMSAACAFLLGLERGVIGYMAGLMLFIIFNLFKGRHKGFPMLPYLSVSFMAAYFIY